MITLGFQSFRMDYVYSVPSGLYRQRTGFTYDVSRASGAAHSNDAERLVPFVATLTGRAGAAQASMTWRCIPGRQYQVWFTDDLNHVFTLQGTYPASATEAMSITVPASLAKGFFKVTEL